MLSRWEVGSFVVARGLWGWLFVVGKKKPACAGVYLFWLRPLRGGLGGGLTQQAEDCLWQLVGLGENRGTGLLHDLLLAEVGGLGGVVGIFDPATGGGDVLGNVLQVTDGVLKAVLDRTQISTLGINCLDSLVNNQHSCLRSVDFCQVNIRHALICNRSSCNSWVSKCYTMICTTSRTCYNIKFYLR